MCCDEIYEIKKILDRSDYYEVDQKWLGSLCVIIYLDYEQYNFKYF